MRVERLHHHCFKPSSASIDITRSLGHIYLSPQWTDTLSETSINTEQANAITDALESEEALRELDHVEPIGYPEW